MCSTGHSTTCTHHLPILLRADELCSCAGAKNSKQKTFYVHLTNTTGKDPGFVFHEDVPHFSEVRC